MKQTILLPIDFSENSDVAILFATQLARQKQYNIHLYHNYTTASAVFEEEIESQIDRENPIFKADVLIQNIVEKLKIAVPTVDISYTCERGIISESLPRLAVPGQYDFIVMGTKGLTNDDSKLIGSTTYVVSKKSEIPVIAIPEDYKNATDARFDKVGLLSNFREEEIQTVQDYVNIMGHDFELKLMHVHFDKDSEDRIEDKLEVWRYKIKKYIGLPDVEIDVDSIEGDIEDLDTVPEVINQMINDEQIKILLVTRSRKSFFERLFTRSIAKQLFDHPLVPIFFTKA